MTGEITYSVLYLYTTVAAFLFLTLGLLSDKKVESVLAVAALWPITLPILFVKLVGYAIGVIFDW